WPGPIGGDPLAQTDLRPPGSQYFGTEGSTWSDQARMPPFKLWILRKPDFIRKSTALALRAPERQWTTNSSAELSSCMRRATAPSGMSVEPGMRQISYSCGWRTSMGLDGCRWSLRRLGLMRLICGTLESVPAA